MRADRGLAPLATGTRPGAPDLLRRVALLAVVWLGLNGSDHASWIVGAPVVLAAAVVGVSLRRPPAPRVRWAGVLPFAGYFVLRSVSGGWDVSRRALRRRIRVSPGFVRFETTLPPGAPRVLFTLAVSLLPGTLVAGADDRDLTVHALDASHEGAHDLRRLERRVAALFRVPEATRDDPR